jgi:hypothetical protein
MKKSEKPIIEVTGGIHVGKTFMKSFQASWPFGKIEIYSDNIVLRIQYIPNFILRLFQTMGKLPNMVGTYKNIPNEITLTYSDIKGYKEKSAGIMGYDITILHANDQQAPFLQIWVSKSKALKIIEYFNNNGIYKKN